MRFGGNFTNSYRTFPLSNSMEDPNHSPTPCI